MSKEIQKVELSENDRELLNSVKDALNNQPKPTVAERSAEHAHEEPKPKHEHFSADLEYMQKKDSCPDCVAGLDKFGKDYMKKTIEAHKDLSHECVNCGLGVDGKESEKDEWKCPTCGEQYAKEREK